MKKILISSIFTVPTMFSDEFFLRVVKNSMWLGKEVKNPMFLIRGGYVIRVGKRHNCLMEGSSLPNNPSGGQIKTFESFAANGENISEQYFLLYPLLFFLILKVNFSFLVKFICVFYKCFQFELF